MKSIVKNESGSVIVEASIIFPTMFLTLFFLMFLGNAYLQKCRAMAIVETETRNASAHFADPLLEYVEKNKVKYDSSIELNPYRYIGVLFGGKSAETELSDQLETQMSKVDTGLFSNMKPKAIVTNIDYKGYFIYSSVTVTMEYTIRMPIRLLGQSKNYEITFSDTTTIPVSDAPETIRNIDFAEDMVQRLTGSEDGFEAPINKITDFISKLKKK